MLRGIDGLAAVSIIDGWPVRGAALAATVLAVVLMLRYARRATSVLLAAVLLAGLVLVDLLLARNAYLHRTTDANALPTPNGTTMVVEIPGERSGFAARPARVYLPPSAAVDPSTPLPVLMLLHGSGGAPEEWLDRGGAARIADWWAARNGGVAPVLVMPDATGAGAGGVGGCVGASERYLTEDVPAAVIARFHTQPLGQGWAVVGDGAGGVCALTLTMLHHDLFPTFADFGGVAAAAPDLTRDPQVLLGQGSGTGLGAWFEVGEADPAAGIVTGFATTAQRAGFDTCLARLPGASNSYPASARAFYQALPWLASRVGQIPTTAELKKPCTVIAP